MFLPDSWSAKYDLFILFSFVTKTFPWLPLAPAAREGREGRPVRALITGPTGDSVATMLTQPTLTSQREAQGSSSQAAARAKAQAGRADSQGIARGDWVGQSWRSNGLRKVWSSVMSLLFISFPWASSPVLGSTKLTSFWISSLPSPTSWWSPVSPHNLFCNVCLTVAPREKKGADEHVCVKCHLVVSSRRTVSAGLKASYWAKAPQSLAEEWAGN